MWLFSKKNKFNSEITKIISPISGTIINIEDVPDIVFADKIVGDGVAIKPTGDIIVAPVNGVIGKIFTTKHAFSIKSNSGIEIFVHFGIDTVELKGDGFQCLAREEKPIKLGDPIIKVDLLKLEKKAKSTITPVVIANIDEVKQLIKFSGDVVVGKSTIMHVIK